MRATDRSLTNDSFMYFGDDEGHPSPTEYALFDYGPTIAGLDDEEGEDDAQAPDDPAALAPRVGVELCAMVVKEVVRVQQPDGPCTWVFGQSLALGRWIRRVYALRSLPIAGCVFPQCSRRLHLLTLQPDRTLESLHPREHVLTDLWQGARAHNGVKIGTLRSLVDWEPVLPPPAGIPDEGPVWWNSGCVHGLDPVANTTNWQALEFRRNPAVHLCECAARGCSRRAYDRNEHTMARCVPCKLWFHQTCLVEAPEPGPITSLTVEWLGGEVSGPASRRVPNLAPAVMVDALRGLRVRVDPPVRSWERVASAIPEALGEAGDVFMSNGHDFLMHWRELVLGWDFEPVRPQISHNEVNAAVQEVLTHGSAVAGAWPLLCPVCNAYI